MKILSIILCLCCINIAHAQNDNAGISTVKLKKDTTLSFELYVPYNSGNLTNKPAFFFFEPWGNGALPVSLYMGLAKKYDFILIGFNSSRNGMPFEEPVGNFNIAFNELTGEYGLNPHLLCLAGFSGAGKVAIKAVSTQSSIKYIVYGGATVDEYLSGKDVLGFGGTRDMNYTDLLDYDKSLNIKTNLRHFIVEYDGAHAWFDSTTMENAFVWLRLNLMSSNLLKKDTAFIEMLSAKYQRETDSLILLKEWLKADNIVKKSQHFLAASTDVKWFSAQQKFIETNPSFKKLKKENEEILSQERITKNNYDNYFFTRDSTWWKTELQRLNGKSNDLQMLSNKRLLGYILISCYYAATDALTTNNLVTAEKILTLYRLSFPSSAEQAFLNAVLYAKKNDTVKSDQFFKEAQRSGFVEWNKDNNETILQYFNRRPIK